MTTERDISDYLSPANLEDLADTPALTDAENETLAEGVLDEPGNFIDTPITKARRENLQRFRAENRLANAQMASILECDPVFVSQLLSKNPYRPVSDKVAQTFEKYFGMQAGHTDWPNAEMPTVSVDEIPKAPKTHSVKPKALTPNRVRAGTNIFHSGVGLFTNVLTLVLEKTRGTNIKPQTVSNIVTLVLADAESNGGKIDEKLLANAIAIFAD